MAHPVTLVLALACLTQVPMSWATCPPDEDVAPCVCRDETPGVTLDCIRVPDAATLVKVFQTPIPEPNFDFLQIVSLDGHSTLEQLPANVFHDKTFRYIWIGASDIAAIHPDAFKGTDTTTLELRIGNATKLVHFPFESLVGFENLFKLHLTNTQITSISQMGNAPMLTEVGILGSQVSSIVPDAFVQLSRLKHLDLSGNPLMKLDADWLAASTTQRWLLYADDCQISSVSSKAFSGSMPAGVFLNGNRLTALPEETFRPLMEELFASEQAGLLTRWIDVTNNPLVCDCHVHWLASSDASIGKYLRGAVCTNGDVAGVPVQDLPESFFDDC